jgi:hypothetical protein
MHAIRLLSNAKLVQSSRNPIATYLMLLSTMHDYK